MSSIQEVAREAGVSTATVSRTFSTPDLLSQQTRQRVLAVADRLNYRPRTSVRFVGKDSPSAATESLDAFGFLFFASSTDSTPINEFYSPVLAGAQSEAGLLGSHLIIRMAPRHTHPSEVPKMFREQTVAGTLLVGAALPDVLAAYAAHLPTSVLVDNRDSTGKHDCVLSDGFDGAFQATMHLIRMGHRNIGFVLDELTAPSFQDRFRGCLCAQWEAGLSPGPRWAIPPGRGVDAEARLAEYLLEPDRPTAIVAANDTNALTVMKVCRDLHLSVPRDMSVVGFDDVPFSVHAYPPLTTVRVDKEHMGRLAIRTLHVRLNERVSPGSVPMAPVLLTVPVSLVERNSCCPPKS